MKSNLVRNQVLVLVAGAVSLLSSGHAFAQVTGGPFSYYAVAPCRAYDTRAGQPSAGGTGGGTITTAAIRSFRLKGFCGVPVDAAAVSVNLTIVNPTAVQGDLRVAPYPGTFPTVSTTNYYAGEVIANGAIVPLGNVNPGTGDDIQVTAAGAPFTQTWTYELLIDLTGYFK